MKSFKCPECGAPIKNNIGMCDYCGVQIKNDEKEKSKDSFKAFEEGLNSAVDSVKRASKKLNIDNVNWILLVILCATFFPVGVIYFIFAVCGSDKK